MSTFFTCKKNKGGILIQVIAFMSIGIFFISSFINWSIMSLRAARHAEAREQVLIIAEAGIDYYRWHLAHDATDFQDGTGVAGPYLHDFLDKSGVIIGTFSLDITAPPVGSTLVVVRSTGALLSDPIATRTIQARFAKPSFAKYALVTNSDVWEDAVEIFGPYHSNGGVHFSNVVAHNIVTSAQTNYTDPDPPGGNRWGVFTSKPSVPFPAGDPQPPTAYPDRIDVFVAGRSVGVPAVDFTGMMSDLSTIRTNAQSGGGYYAPSGGFGYYILLKNTDKFDIYRVTAMVAPPSGACAAWYTSGGDTYGGTWSIQTKVLITADVDIPANGLIFTEDDVWVEGQIDTSRVTIAAARFPDNATTRASIVVNNSLLYTNYDGSDSIGLIAQGYVRVGLASADTLRIDAALIAQSGAIWRDFYYEPFCGAGSKRAQITTYGSLISNERYTFSWYCGAGCSSGYATQISNYDTNLLYSPPPSFPLTTDKYQSLSWDEI